MGIVGVGRWLDVVEVEVEIGGIGRGGVVVGELVDLYGVGWEIVVVVVVGEVVVVGGDGGFLVIGMMIGSVEGGVVVVGVVEVRESDGYGGEVDIVEWWVMRGWRMSRRWGRG